MSHCIIPASCGYQAANHFFRKTESEDNVPIQNIAAREPAQTDAVNMDS